MGYLDSLAQGLRLGGGVLNPQVQEFNQRDEMAATNALRQRQQFMLAQAIRAAESGAADPAQVQQFLAQQGVNMPQGFIGPDQQTQARQQALKNEQGFRDALAQNPNATFEDRARIATQFGKPELAVQYEKAVSDRETRREAQLARAQQATEMLDFRRDQLDQQFQLGIQNITDRQARDAFERQYKTQMQALTAQRDRVNEEMRRMGLELRSDSNEIRRELADMRGGVKAPSGYEWTDDTRRELRPIAGGPATVLSPEQSGKKAMTEQAVQDIDKAEALLFDKKGELRRDVVAGGMAPMGGVGEDARLLNSYVRNAISAKYRLETGAAGNQGEIDDIQSRFKPNLLDTKKTAQDKMTRLREFMTMSLSDMKVKGLVKSDAQTPPPSDQTPRVRKYNPTTGKLE